MKSNHSGMKSQALSVDDIETAIAEYSMARVATLRALPSNPYHAELQTVRPLRGFLVQATTSPMMNQIRGDSHSSPVALSALVRWFEDRQCVAAVVLPVRSGKPASSYQIGAQRLRRLSGWTHVQLAAPIANLSTHQIPLEIEEVTSDTIHNFADIHAEAFRTEGQRQPINRASLAGLLAGDKAKGFLVRVNGKPASGAILYFASNKIAYLGTAATRRVARGQGCHSVLIAYRIEAARRNGSQFVAATAMPK